VDNWKQNSFGVSNWSVTVDLHSLMIKKYLKGLIKIGKT